MTIPQAEHLAGGAIAFRVPYRREWVAAVKSTVPSDYRSWDPDDKTWTVWPPYGQDVLRLTRGTFGGVRETNGGSQIPDEHFRILHLRETAPPELIEASYRVMARLHHPDRGGDHAAMLRINSAYEILRELEARS